ncbi:FadR/GntR family transcriptional regulator [Brachybacterium sacelli]|uniref:DNA-binding FadR family transcriptional regulator n=1 Tax=Brachybacterium sacelli TaxID=173364 RepID=A0ABS4WVE2_9MICO|nr:FCD domain-containing protein [Brachybacterium sacelli]MBP2380174.1 DNA-binding FadR family transcriptional regulator [Brachybacterium sacelli]
MSETRLTTAVDALGAAIVSGHREPGESMTMQELEAQYSVSRSIMREAVRALQTMGLVTTTKRIGVTILPASRWNHFAPEVIRWKLDSEDDAAPLRSLNELRAAVEPVAAGLAATHAPSSYRLRLLELAGEIRTAVITEDRERFLAADVEYHDLILRASGNEMFAQLQNPVAATVAGRDELGLLPNMPDSRSLALHQEIAEAIHLGDAARAQDLDAELVAFVIQETRPSWEGSQRFYPADAE